MQRLLTFPINGKDVPIKFVEFMNVKDGVDCEVYAFVNDDTKDLGIVTVRQGSSTPKQKVLQGKRTIEGYLSGKGVLKITQASGERLSYAFPNTAGLKEVTVIVGDTMQWAADEELVFYEICEPPYRDGRFQNLD